MPDRRIVYQRVGKGMQATAPSAGGAVFLYGIYQGITVGKVSEPAIPWPIREQYKINPLRAETAESLASAQHLITQSDNDPALQSRLINLKQELSGRIAEMDARIDVLAAHPETITYADSRDEYHALNREITSDIMGATLVAALLSGAGTWIIGKILRRQARFRASEAETI